MVPFKTCSCCRRAISAAQWNCLPPAAGGLHAMEMEWRNCFCGSTLVIDRPDLGTLHLPDETPRQSAEGR